jgi:alpha-tubulin suppressor-like RCC1 family protein
VAPTIHSVFPLGRLIAGETCKLKVICNVEAKQQPVATVTADLTSLGGEAVQNLSQQPDGTWRWTGTVYPLDNGLKSITVTATDNESRQTVFIKEIRTHMPGKAIAIAAGNHHTLALKADGTVVCWGGNVYGECNVPDGLTEVVAVAGGGGYSFALRFDGTMVCWGDNWVNQCGAPEETDDAVAISAAYAESLVLKADGTLRCSGGGRVWGACDIPPDLGDVTAISMGFGFGLAVRSDGTVACWGKNDAGECNVPLGLHNVVAVTGGYEHSLALKENSSVVAWGGRRVQPVRHRMVPPGLGKLTAIDTRGNESNTVDMGLRQDGTVVIWWKPKDGWLFQVSRGLKQSIAIASGWYHYLALGEDGSVTAWGDNYAGQCDVPAELQ